MRNATANTVRQICDAALAEGVISPCRRETLVIVAAKLGVNFNDAAFASIKVGRGEYNISNNVGAVAPQVELENPIQPTLELARNVENVKHNISHSDLVPDEITSYVPFGNYEIVKKIVKKGGFFPTYITGLSGNGKTTMIEQVCCELNVECVRVNITAQTDEDDLLGGFRLVDGETVWQDGPVVIAMQRGAVLILDEVDLASHRIMCLQPVLEGRGIYLKKVNRKVVPAKGFNVFATANTKGQGGENSEKFAGTGILNEAFLERFRITIEQDYPPMVTEKRIVRTLMREHDCYDENFADALCKWADIIRKSYRDGAVSEIISTRRLEHIVNAFAIFNDRIEAIRYCVARFPADVRDAFLSLYEKIDETVTITKANKDAAKESPSTVGGDSSPQQLVNNLVNELVNITNKISSESDAYALRA